MDGIYFLILLGATILVAVDYSNAGKILLHLANNKDVTQRFGQTFNAFSKGLAYYNFAVVTFSCFWIVVLILQEIVPVQGFVLFIVVMVYLIICVTAVVGRRRWWNNLISVNKEDLINEQLSTNSSELETIE